MTFDSLRRLLFRISGNPLSIVGAAIMVMLIIVTLGAPILAPYPKHIGIFVDFANTSHSPSLAHWFGTDDVGRDILSRAIFGLRTSLGLSILVLAIAVPVGVIIGLVAGYFGGLAGAILMRITDIFLALPPLVLAMAIMGLLAPTMTNVMVAISVMYRPWHACGLPTVSHAACGMRITWPQAASSAHHPVTSCSAKYCRTAFHRF